MRVSRARVGSLRVGAGLPEDRERWIRPFGTARSEEPKPSGPTGAGNATPCKARNPRRSFGRSRPRPQDRGPSPRPTSAPRGPLARGPRAPRLPYRPVFARTPGTLAHTPNLLPFEGPVSHPRVGASTRRGDPARWCGVPYRGARQILPGSPASVPAPSGPQAPGDPREQAETRPC
jgi:hypothetical protein